MLEQLYPVNIILNVYSWEKERKSWSWYVGSTRRHLEVGEEWGTCAIRETKEETNLDCKALSFNAVTNDRFIDGNPMKHYITIFMNIEVKPGSALLSNLEPEKCEGWEWMNHNDLRDIHKANEGVLFDPLARFIDEGNNSFQHQPHLRLRQVEIRIRVRGRGRSTTAGSW